MLLTAETGLATHTMTHAIGVASQHWVISNKLRTWQNVSRNSVPLLVTKSVRYHNVNTAAVAVLSHDPQRQVQSWD